MSPNHIVKIWIAILTTLGSLLSGCESERVADVATTAADRQAQQTLMMGELNREVASGSRAALVAADAAAREDIVGVLNNLQDERGRLDNQWTALEQERREVAHERRTASLLLPAAQVLGGVLLVITLLGFCSRVLDRARCDEGSDGHLNELLVQELLADRLPVPSDSAVPAIDVSPSAPRIAGDKSLSMVVER